MATVLNDYITDGDWQIRRLGSTQRGALVRAEMKLIRMHRKQAAHRELTYRFEVDDDGTSKTVEA